jgi:uncharacterized protein YecT (DUF1311 family)
MTEWIMRHLFVLLPLLAAPAVAQPSDGRSEAYRQCMTSGDAAKGNATAIELCAGAELALQEQQLESAYQRALRRLGLRYQAMLRNAQVDWRREVQETCAERAAVDRRGDLAGFKHSRCMLDEVVARIAWVEEYPPE